MLAQEGHASFLLVGAAKDADKDMGGVQVSGDVNVVDADEAGFTDRELAADGLADGALQQFAHALDSMRRHGAKSSKKWIVGLVDYWIVENAAFDSSAFSIHPLI